MPVGHVADAKPARSASATRLGSRTTAPGVRRRAGVGEHREVERRPTSAVLRSVVREVRVEVQVVHQLLRPRLGVERRVQAGEPRRRPLQRAADAVEARRRQPVVGGVARLPVAASARVARPRAPRARRRAPGSPDPEAELLPARLSSGRSSSGRCASRGRPAT